MEKHTIILTLFLISILLSIKTSNAENIFEGHNSKPAPIFSQAQLLHTDTTKNYTFKPNKENKGASPYIVSGILIAGGTALHFSDSKQKLQNWASDHVLYSGTVEDPLRYLPAATVYALNAFGLKGKNNFGNRTALALKSLILNDLIVVSLKEWTNVERPNGGKRSFPSGHSSTAFVFAHFMHKEYGHISPWFSIGAYASATTVAFMRVAKDAHWVSDVLVGAGIGILSTEIIYRTHLYKWDKEHLKNFDIFPFKMGKQKGLSLVYNF